MSYDGEGRTDDAEALAFLRRENESLRRLVKLLEAKVAMYERIEAQRAAA